MLTQVHIHMDAYFMSVIVLVCVCVSGIFTGAEEAGLGLRVLEGQTSIVRHGGDTGLSALVGRRLGQFAAWD